MSATALLASVADMQITLNDSFRVAEVASDSGSLRQLPRDELIGRPWLEFVRESDTATAEAALTAAVSEPGTAHRVDLALVLSPESDELPTCCWLCANDTDHTIQLACIDLRGETNLRQQLVNAQRTLEQDYWSNRRLEARYRRMLEMVAEGFLVVDDLSGRVLEANTVAGSILELEAGALVGRIFPVGLDTNGNRALT